MMDAARWDELETIFGQALALPPAARASFLDRACAGNAELRAELDSLLVHYEEAPGYFESLANAVPPLDLSREASPEGGGDPYDLSGASFSHYRVLEKLGGGGMGVVYKAEDTELGRTVALKFLPPHLRADDKARQRFIAEAKAASALDHPNICTIYEIGRSDDGRTFIAMACYDGETLKQKIERGPLPVEEALGYAAQVAQGLEKAHAQGIVHRDVKPANVMVTEDDVVKVLDFGLAKVADQHLTKSGTTMGTAAYMSPEQTRGEPVDARTDVWSLGVMLYEMLAGARPFRGDYDQAIVYAILHEDPPPLAAYDVDAPEDVEHVVTLCLEKDRDLRYPSVADLRADLEVWTRGVDSDESLARRAARRRRVGKARTAALVGAGVVAAALVLGLAFQAITGASGAADAAEIHLAVLPFAETQADSTDQLGDGLRLTLTSTLAQMARYADAPLRIVPASEVAGVTTAADARQTFGVNRVITGRVRYEGAQLHLDLDLSDAERLSQLHAVTVTAASTDEVASMQAGLVSGLAELLEIPLTPQARRALTAGGTADSRAYAFYLKGRAALERLDQPENIDTAIQLFEFALEEDSLYALARAGLGRAYAYQYERTKDTLWIARAEHSSRRALDRDDRLAEARLTLGLMYTHRGALEKAIRQYDLALALDSSDADVYLDKANVYEQLDRVDEAEATYLQGIRKRPDYYRLYNKLGNLYLRNKRYEEAATQFRTVIDLTPDNTWGYNNLGSVYLYQNRLDSARRWFDRSIEVQPNYIAYSNLGVIAYYEKRHSDEARTYEQALALDSTSYVVWGNLAGAYSRIPEERHKALATYQRAIQLAEAEYAVNANAPRLRRNLATYYRKLGVLYYEENRHSDEARMYEHSLTFDDDNLVVWENLAKAYQKIPEEHRKVPDTYRQAAHKAEAQRAARPDDADLLNRLVRYYLILDQPTKALPVLEHALATNPDHVPLMVQAGRFYELRGDRATALTWVEKALENGYARTALEEDTVFTLLRADPRFARVVNPADPAL